MKNIKVIIAVIITAVLCTSISVFATIQIQANQIGYSKDGIDMTVEDAINDLYRIKDANVGDYKVLETGTVNSNTLGKSAAQTYTITFENTYTSEQKAFLIITSPVRKTGSINPYIQSAQFINYIDGNTLSFQVLNYIGSGSGSVSFDYAVVTAIDD